MIGNRFLAKSSKSEVFHKEDTIMGHTERLLEEYERLGTLYPFLKENEKRWEMLKVVCLFHDFGKLNRKFQKRIEEKKKTMLPGEIHHAVLSMAFLNLEILEDEFGEEYAEEIFKAVLFHHNRSALLEAKVEHIRDEVEEMTQDYYAFLEEVKKRKEEYPKLYEGLAKYTDDFENPKNNSIFFDEYFYGLYRNDVITDSEKDYNNNNGSKAKTYIFIKGLLNRIDYAASAGIFVEHENSFLEEGLECFMKNLNDKRSKAGKRNANWNSLQIYMKDNSEENLIVLAQTGMGKTEAALWWIGNNKGFFTLPIRTAINSIYERIRTKVLQNKGIENRLGLLHSDSLEYYFNLDERGEIRNVDLQDYYIKTKQSSLPVTIATLDQVFLFVLRYAGFEEKLATMAYSKVVIDEVQMYGADLTAYLILGLLLIQKMGGKFAILTATFPSFIKDLMKKAGITFKEPIERFVEKDRIRHSVIRKHESINVDFIFNEYDKNREKRILVICNTVRKCQEIYRNLMEKMEIAPKDLKKREVRDRELNMLHARFIKRDRKMLEEAIFAFTDEKSQSHGIWITSSIAEASLDIDFDLLITELSDINSFFQRLGRCYRRRIWTEEGYNCVLFDGGSDVCSGVGEKQPISDEIFGMSKEAMILKFPESISVLLDEETKMEIVEEIYSTENIIKKANTFYTTVKNYLKEICDLDLNEMSKKKAIEMFRNIRSITMIPLPVYEENKEDIDSMEVLLNQNDTSAEEKIKLRQKIREYTVDIRFERYLKFLKKRKVIKEVKTLFEIPVIDCHYDSLTGEEEKKEEDGGEGIFI